MAQPFIGMIITVGFNFAPNGWALCQGQLMAISQNTALFSLLGTTFGGDGQTTFALPDLQGRVPVGQGQGPGLSNYVMGEVTGTENTTLLVTQMPAHNHAGSTFSAANNKATSQPPVAGAFVGRAIDGAPNPTSVPQIYVPAANATTPVTLGGLNIAAAGGNQPFSTLQPILGMNQSISLFGIFPSRN